MEFDPGTAKEVGFEYSFDPSSAKPVEEVTFDASTAEPVHDWGTTDARDKGVVNKGMTAPERTGTSWDRIKLAAEEAYAVNPTTGRNAGVEKLKTAQNMLKDIERDPFKTPQYLPHIEKLQKEGQDELRKYILLRKGIGEKMAEANPALWERILGGAAGGLTDPINLFGVGNASTLPRTLAKQFFTGAGVGVLSALEQGNFDKAIDLVKDDPTIQDLMDAGLTTGTISAILSGIFHVAARPGAKPKLDTQLELDAKKAVEDIIKKRDPGLGADVDTSKAKAPQYLGAKSDATIALENQASDYAAKEGITYEPANRQLELKDARGRFDPDFIDTSELAAAEAKANRSAQATSNLPQAADVMMGIPDVKEESIRSPYMTPEETARAQAQVEKTGEPAHSYMEIPEEMGREPYWPDKDLEKAKAKANSRAEHPEEIDITRKAATEGAEKATGTEERNPALSAALRKAKNLGEALDAIGPYVEETTKAIYDKLLRVADPLTKYNVFEWFPEFRRASLEDAAGVYRTLEDGRTDIQVRGDTYKVHGLDVETTLHEAVHSVTDAAFRIANSELINKPEFKAHKSYVNDISALWKAIQNQMQRDVNKSGKAKTLYGKEATAWAESFGKDGKMPKDASEFNSYAWTNPEFRALLKEIKLDRYKKTAWEVVKDAFRKLLGKEVGTRNALKEVDSFIDRLDEIQGVPQKDLATAVGGEVGTRNIKVGDIAKGITEKYDDAKSLLEAFKSELEDIKFSQKMLPLTANQAGEWFGNPIVEWSYNRLRRIGNDIDVRANLNKIYLKDVIDFMKSDRESALKMINTLVKIQDPALKEARAAAEASGAREAFLASQGMPESVIPHAIKVLDVMKATGIYDQNVAYDFRGHNFHLEPMYFPKEHTGPFTVYIKQADGTVVHAQPFEHMKGARQYEQAFKKSIPEGADMIVSLERNEAGRMGDVYSMLNITGDKLPDFLRDINDKLLKDIEVAKRKFEMERSSHNITGATGEKIYGENSLTSWKRAQDQRALSLIQRRLESSYSLEKAKRIIKEIKEPFLEDPMGMLDKDGKPMLELTNYMHQLIARELGLDISKFQAAQKATVDRAVTGFGKTIDEFAGKMRGYNGGDMSYFKPNEMARLIQTYVWLMSVSKLGWSVPVLAANSTTGLLAPVDGIRTAMREGINPGLAVLSGMKTLMATLDPEVSTWLSKADLEGMVEPRISDPMTFVQTHYRTAADKFVNAARDFVEKKTNQVTLAYYYNFYKMAYPDLDPNSNQFKTKVYKAARSWTGDYTNEAQVMQLSQLGYIGQLHSNFAKWKYNQLGRLAVDLKQAFQGNALPMAMTMMIGVMLAGAMGAPVAVEYENFRKALKTLSEDTIDLKPWARAYSDLREWGKEHLGTPVSTVMDVLERGPMMYYGDKAAKEAGFNSGIDMSANLKYSALSDVSTLPFSFGGEQYKGMSAALKALWMTGTENPTNEQMKDMAKVFPIVVSRPLQEFIENKIQTGDAFKNGYVQQFATQAKGSYRQTPWEKGLAYAGFKTVAENQEMDKIFGKEWNDRRVKTLITKQIKRMETNLDRPEILQEAATKIYEERGVAGVQAAINALLQRKQDVNTTYFERELMRSVNVPDPIARTKLLHELKKFLPEE